jgi:hypothetical protein
VARGKSCSDNMWRSLQLWNNIETAIRNTCTSSCCQTTTTFSVLHTQSYTITLRNVLTPQSTSFTLMLSFHPAAWSSSKKTPELYPERICWNSGRAIGHLDEGFSVFFSPYATSTEIAHALLPALPSGVGGVDVFLSHCMRMTGCITLTQTTAVPFPGFS